jgi:hypothetical protein
MFPQPPSPALDVGVLVTGTCEYATLNGKRDFIDVVKIRILRLGDYPMLSTWGQYYLHRKKDQSQRR